MELIYLYLPFSKCPLTSEHSLKTTTSTSSIQYLMTFLVLLFLHNLVRLLLQERKTFLIFSDTRTQGFL